MADDLAIRRLEEALGNARGEQRLLKGSFACFCSICRVPVVLCVVCLSRILPGCLVHARWLSGHATASCHRMPLAGYHAFICLSGIWTL